VKRVLITGASSGIGTEVAFAAAADGWYTFLGYKTGSSRAEAQVSLIEKAGGKAQSVSLPLDSVDDVSASILSIKGLDQLDALVLCASPKPVLASFLKTDPLALTDQFKVNVLGNHRLMVEVWKRYFRNNKVSQVIAISSLAAASPPWPHMTSYVFGKRALQSLLESALSEFGASGLSATLISPDYTETPMLMNVEPHVLELARSQRRDGAFLQPKVVAQEVLNSLNAFPKPGVLEMKSISLSRHPL